MLQGDGQKRKASTINKWSRHTHTQRERRGERKTGQERATDRATVMATVTAKKQAT